MPKKNNRKQKVLKPVLHIYCEGEKTEPNYLNGYINRYFPSNRRLKVIKIEATKKNTPKQLVEEAVNAKTAAKNNGLEDDTFWVVYDRESKQKYADALHSMTYEKAQKNQVSIALSNVCFEAWLLLHFQDTTASYNCYDDLRSNSALRDECKKRGLVDYDKGNKEIFNILEEDDIKKARNRAMKINQQTKMSADSSCTKPFHWNPYTDLHLLLDAIDKLAEQ